jgi:phage shock protein PspC (stress-responsive transcriptional regulator)
MRRLNAFFEQQAFGVCTEMGTRLGVATASIRMYFIYASFLTLGSPVLIYLALAFLMNIHKHLRRKRSTIWDF